MEINELKEADWKKIMEYTRDQLLKQCITAKYDNDYLAQVIPKAILLSLPQLVKLPEFLASIGEKKQRSKIQPVADDKGFSAFWDAYPATPTFKHKNRTFTDSRTLRSNKQVCQTKYLNYLYDHPEVTPDMMLKALKLQLQMAKDESVEQSVNRLARWNGLEVYLNQAKFEPFLYMTEAETSQDAGASGDLNDNCG